MIINKIAKFLLNIKGNIKYIELNEPRCKVYTYDDSIWLLMREIYFLEIYGSIKNYKGIVIDAGAHCGSFSIPVSFYSNEVISIEPDPINLKILELNKIINSRDNIKILPFALYSKKEELVFIRDEISGSGKIQIEGNGIKIKTITLDEILENYKEIELLKIDIEGAEFDVLMNTKNINKIKKIIGELHYEDKKLRDELEKFLKSNNFEFVEIEKNKLYNNFSSLMKAFKNSKIVKNHNYLKFMIFLYLSIPFPKPLVNLEKKEKTTLFIAYTI